MKIAKTVLGCILLLFVGFVMLKVPALFCVTAVAVLVSLILVVIPKTRAATLIKVYQLVSLFISLKVGTLIFIVVGLWAAASVSEYLRSDVVNVQVGAKIQQRTPREYEKDLIVARYDYKQRIVKAAQNAFAILFDVSKTSGLDSSKSDVLLERMILFFVIWLLGGGVMISAMVEQFDKIRDCEFRLPKWMLKLVDHVVIFGWNSAVLSFLGQKDGNNNLIHRNRLVIILTTSDSRLIRTQIDDIEGFNSANCLIYRCEYDDKSERECLLGPKGKSRLQACYVVGEGQLSEYDSRAILLANELSSKTVDTKPLSPNGATEPSSPNGATEPSSKNCICEHIYCNIHDFGLSTALQQGNNSVKYKSFYDDWARCIWDGNEIKWPLYVIGLGAMGKAVVLSALKKKPNDEKIFVTIMEPESKKLTEEWWRLENEFKKDTEEFISDNSLQNFKWNDISEKITKECPGTVVVAMRKGEKGLIALSQVVDMVGAKVAKEVDWYLSQEIDGYSSNKCDNELPLLLDGSKQGESLKVKLFGMNRGAPWKTEE